MTKFSIKGINLPDIIPCTMQVWSKFRTVQPHFHDTRTHTHTRLLIQCFCPLHQNYHREAAILRAYLFCNSLPLSVKWGVQAAASVWPRMLSMAMNMDAVSGVKEWAPVMRCCLWHILCSTPSSNHTPDVPELLLLSLNLWPAVSADSRSLRPQWEERQQRQGWRNKQNGMII